MTRALGRLIFGLLLLVPVCALGQESKPAPPPEQEKQREAKPPEGAVEALPEEDETLVEKTEYSFNPIQAEKEVKVGDFYWRKGTFKGAAMRYEEATKWNPGMAEAWLKLGRARDKMGEKKEALAAYAKYVEMEPDSKDAKKLKKILKSAK